MPGAAGKEEKPSRASRRAADRQKAGASTGALTKVVIAIIMVLVVGYTILAVVQINEPPASSGNTARAEVLAARLGGEASALRAAGRGDEDAVRGPVVVIVFSDADMQHYLDAVSELRNAGIAAELYLGRAGMKAQMKYADRRGAPAAVILGGDEIAAGQVTVKDLDAGRALAAGVSDNEAWKAERPGQQVVARSELVATVARIVARARAAL